MVKSIICQKCLVSGRVQGVWYRDSTQQMAQQLDVVGYARNLADGRVEVLACGSQHAVDELKQWLWQGPKMARVEQVICQGLKPESVPQKFTTA